jgi:hypothetical protein
MFPSHSDEVAIINIEWSDEKTSWHIQIPWLVAKLDLLKDRTVGAPKVHNVTGVESEDWIDYSYILKASAAFGLLQPACKIPQDAVLQTFGEDVPYDAEEKQLDEEASN